MLVFDVVQIRDLKNALKAVVLKWYLLILVSGFGYFCNHVE